ncbi:hypothetical protein ANN_09738 [Periplaneta americana]|uniref:Uncharacterized protein n=1 Tax=Periplaneta americana TaxID=6978 RepID=A0ABQ8TM75_PERAM|nr:hypothetical protein ANN_09738 [Periplaneta americana]
MAGLCEDNNEPPFSLKAIYPPTCNRFIFPRRLHRGTSTPVPRVTMNPVEGPRCIALPPTTNDHIFTGFKFGGDPQPILHRSKTET